MSVRASTSAPQSGHLAGSGNRTSMANCVRQPRQPPATVSRRSGNAAGRCAPSSRRELTSPPSGARRDRPRRQLRPALDSRRRPARPLIRLVQGRAADRDPGPRRYAAAHPPGVLEVAPESGECANPDRPGMGHQGRSARGPASRRLSRYSTATRCGSTRILAVVPAFVCSRRCQDSCGAGSPVPAARAPHSFTAIGGCC